MSLLSQYAWEITFVILIIVIVIIIAIIGALADVNRDENKQNEEPFIATHEKKRNIT